MNQTVHTPAGSNLYWHMTWYQPILALLRFVTETIREMRKP